MTFDPDRPCPHEDFAADVDVNRLGDGAHGQPDKIIGYSAEIRIRCADCGEPFRWIGVPAGMHPRHPACSPDETELRAPIRPASSDPDFGMGIPGFAIRMVGPPGLLGHGPDDGPMTPTPTRRSGCFRDDCQAKAHGWTNDTYPRLVASLIATLERNHIHPSVVDEYKDRADALALKETIDKS